MESDRLDLDATRESAHDASAPPLCYATGTGSSARRARGRAMAMLVMVSLSTGILLVCVALAVTVSWRRALGDPIAVVCLVGLVVWAGIVGLLSWASSRRVMARRGLAKIKGGEHVR